MIVKIAMSVNYKKQGFKPLFLIPKPSSEGRFFYWHWPGAVLVIQIDTSWYL